MNGMPKLLVWFGGVALAVFITCILLVAAFWLEKCPLTYTNIPFPTDSEIHAGETLSITIDRCLSRDTFYTITRKLVNAETGEAIQLPSYSTDVAAGCHHDVGLPVTTSVKMKPGLYVDKGVAHVYGAFGKHFAVPWISSPFRVLPPLP